MNFSVKEMNMPGVVIIPVAFCLFYPSTMLWLDHPFNALLAQISMLLWILVRLVY